MMLLFVQTSDLEQTAKEDIRSKVCEQLSQSWQGRRVDRAFMESLGFDFPTGLVTRFDAADRLAHLMATARDVCHRTRHDLSSDLLT